MLTDKKPTQSFKVTSTAKIVAAMKFFGKEPNYWKQHAHQAGKRDKPLYKDELLKHFIDAETENRVKHMGHQLLSVAARHRYFRETLSKEVKNPLRPIQQVVILGSGYDTRAARKKKYSTLYGVKFYEIDYPELLQEKQRIYKEHSIEANAYYIGMDYTKEDFIQSLKEKGLDLSKPTHIIWEGNIMYLEKEDLDKVLTSLKKHFKHFILSLDYVHLAFLENRTGNKEVEIAFEKFKQRGSVWKTGLENIKQLAEKYGLSIVDDQTISELEKRYQVDNDPVPTTAYYSVCTLEFF